MLEPFALWSLAPASVREHMFNLTWDHADLFALPLPTEDVMVADLTWQLQLPCWRAAQRHFVLSPAEVAREPSRHVAQWQRAMDAELSHPIFLVDGPRRETVLDGLHRLLKAYALGIERLPCRRLTSRALHQIAKRARAGNDFVPTAPIAPRSRSSARSCVSSGPTSSKPASSPVGERADGEEERRSDAHPSPHTREDGRMLLARDVPQAVVEDDAVHALGQSCPWLLQHSRR